MSDAPPHAPADNPFRERRLNDADDFRPQWDVPSLNGDITAALVAQIERGGGCSTPDPGQLIPVLLSAGGYGKTHLFGRLRHALAGSVFFVFVPAINDPRRPLEHIRWHVVESLFDAPAGGAAPIEDALAGLCRESFVAYLEQLPADLAAQHADLLQAAYDGPTRVREVVAAVREGEGAGLRPFLRLADSVAAGTPHLPAAVVRALALGWSPAADRARRWLRGETLPEEDLAELDLPREPALPIYVLQGVAALLGYRTPTVLCCDQLDSVLKDREEGPRQLAIQLMEILAEVPNQFIILSCLEDQWRLVVANKSADAFRQRVREHLLAPLGEGEAVELVANRLADWRWESGPGDDALWPFDRDSIVRYAADSQPNPRALVARCAEAFDLWLEGPRQESIDLTRASGRGPDLLGEFRKAWARELAAIRGNPRRGPASTQEARLFKAVEATLEIARRGGKPVGGVYVRSVRDEAIRPGGAQSRLALRVELEGGSGGAFEVVVPVTKLDNGPMFFHYYRAVQEAMAGPAVGALLIHARRQFAAGNQTRAEMAKAEAAGRLRLFALEEHRPAFDAMECALALVEKAGSQELQLGGQALSADACRDWIVKAGVLEGLDLFAALGEWKRE